VLLVAGAFILIYLIGAWIVRAIQRRRQRLRPNGALRRPRLPAGGHHRGRVAVDASTVVGLSGAAGVAHALRLRTGRFLHSDLMLVDGRSAGFLVQLEDGRQVRVPAGRVRLQGPVKRERVVSRARADLRVDRLDPLGQQLQSAEELDPIPYDRAGELVLRPGDPVELWGRLEPVVDPRAAHGGYRQPAASLLEPVGPFVLGLAG
jgi:hypothetical protein